MAILNKGTKEKILQSPLGFLYKWYLNMRLHHERKFAGKSTKEIMTAIYAQKLWSGSEEFYSGEGSHQPSITQPYVTKLNEFFYSFPEKLIVCDFGCGDFEVGKQLVDATKQYFAFDIVDALIERNKKMYQKVNLQFETIDLVTDNLPDADVAIVRQVLQHLSNKDIGIITEKLYKYKYLLITENIPEKEFLANIDKYAGPYTRVLTKNSGVVLTEVPFNLKPLVSEELLRINDFDGSLIVTNLYTMY